MNWEYLHLISHQFAIVLPVVGAAVGLAGWLAGREELERYGVLTILLGGIAAIPSYFTGIAAADDVTQRLFITPSVVQTHRSWATWAAVALITAGIFAAYSIAQPRERRLRRFVLLFAAAASVLTGLAAYRGGQIEHGDERNEEAAGNEGATRAEGAARNEGPTRVEGDDIRPATADSMETDE